MKIGFIGLGNMGSGMAANLLKARHELTVYNRTAEKAAALVDLGARLAKTPADASKGDIVFTMLADDEALENAALGEQGVVSTLAQGAIHVSSSTISVALSERLTREHAHRSQRFVSAPVFGRPEAARTAKLFVAAAGPKDAVERLMPLFEVIGQKTFRFGDTPSSANLVKLSGNFLIASTIEALSEAMALIAKGGLDRQQYLEFLTSTLFAAPVYKTYGGLIADQKFTPAGFAAPLGFKDVRLALAAGEGLRVPLPLASLIRDRFLRLLAEGGEALDWSAISGLALEDAGLAER
ncbi:MAG: NAD(P)-dependent oxidoreductase [Acidobacteria bacterium]|nr:NAD(P)-dependent oxidoreductase [Acidobacteriota bacterium]